MEFKTTNPTLKRVERYCSGDMLSESDETFSAASHFGVAMKSLYFVLVTIVSTVIFAKIFSSDIMIDAVLGLLIAAAIVTFVSGLIASISPMTAAVFGSIYVIGEGALIGLTVACLPQEYKGLVLFAFLSALGVFGIITVLYATGVVRVGSKFRKYLFSVLLGILVTQLVAAIVSIFSVEFRYMIYGNGPLAIIVSVVMVLVAALYIFADLSRISEMVDSRMEKKYEWLAAYSLSVTLIWLFVELLRLLTLLAKKK